jgi:predicted pyridoxine 5'-phosphate oxidase superfamily flavin-nucleotide-binding protein
MVAGLPGRTGILTEDMRRVVREQRLGFVATVCPDGTPSLSPKGTTAVWGGDHLVFADYSVVMPRGGPGPGYLRALHWRQGAADAG